MAKVYSTDSGRLCPNCEQAKDRCICKHNQIRPSVGDGIIRVRRETKGRKGAGVTIIDGLSLDGNSLKKTAKQLKTFCGSGGSIKEGVIEIQGDHRQKICDWLIKNGHKAKVAGG